MTWTWKCPWLYWRTSPHRCQLSCPWVSREELKNTFFSNNLNIFRREVKLVKTLFSSPTWTFSWLSISWSYPLVLREVPQKSVSWILSAEEKRFWKIFFQYILSNKTNLIIFEAKFAILERNVNSARSLGRISVKKMIWYNLNFLFFFTFEQEHWHRVLSKIDHKVSKSVKFIFIFINTTGFDIHSFLWSILIMKDYVKPWKVFRILAKLFRQSCCNLCPFIFLQWIMKKREKRHFSMSMSMIHLELMKSIKI